MYRGFGRLGFAMFYDTSDLKSDEIYLKLVKTSEAVPEKGWVPSYSFKIRLVSDDTEVGDCMLRIGNTEKVYFNGNIGYNVDERHRGNRYAAKACRLLFLLARKHNMDYMYVSCNPDNRASRRTLEYAGGILQSVIELPADNEMYIEKGERRKCIYRIDLR
jgi:tagatose 1,6-diphosphate aldolase